MKSQYFSSHLVIALLNEFFNKSNFQIMDELGDNGEKGVIDVTCVRMYRPGDPEVEETQPLLEKKGIKSFDEALDSTGVGFFHVLLILVSGWALASDSVEVQCISFVTPQLSADYGNPDPALDLDDVSGWFGCCL